VDLPGYGFAKRSKKERAKLEQMISSYILQREEMTNLFLLIDCRHEPQTIDLGFMEWLGESGIPFSIVFTKADKLSRAKLNANIEAYLHRLSEQWDPLPPYFVTSSEKGNGRDELLSYIEQINKGL
jgi:GTP-binding protein